MKSHNRTRAGPSEVIVKLLDKQSLTKSSRPSVKPLPAKPRFRTTFSSALLWKQFDTAAFFKQLSFVNDQWRPKGLQEAVLRDNPFFARLFYSVFKYWPSKYFDQAWCFCWTALLLCNFYSDKYFRKHNSFMFSKKLLWEKYYCGALFKSWGGSRDLANKE